MPALAPQLILSLILWEKCAGFASMSSQRPFALNVKFEVQPDRRAEFLETIQEDQRLTLSEEPGALQFALGEDVDTPNTFYLHEQYTSEEAYQAHTEAPYFATWMAFCDTGPFAPGTEPVVDFYCCSHEPVRIPVRPAFCLNVELCVKPEVRDEFLGVIRNNQDGSNREPLCLQYHWGESADTPNAFYFHEQYVGDDGGLEGFNAHAATPHFAVWEEFASTRPFTKPPVVSKFKATTTK